MRVFTILIPLVGIASMGLAQDKAKPSDPITTDRPDFTESSVVVPKKWLQIESGLTYQGFRSGSVFTGPELLTRYGLSDRSELRLGLPDYGRMRVAGRNRHGFGDTYLGAKFQIGPLKNGDDVAVIPAVSIPSGNANFSSGSTDFELKICWSTSLGAKWTLAAMAYGLWTTNDGDRALVYQQTASFGRELTDKLAMFIEYAGSFQKFGQPDHVAHAGFVYQPSANTQVDIHGGFSMNGPDRTPFIAAGYSIRF